MTPVEAALVVLRRVLGDRLAGRIRANLPSRKPQLWEGLPRALFRRVELAWQTRFDQNWTSRRVIVRLREFDVVMELTLGNQFIDLPLFKYGVYEISGTRFLQAVLEPGMTVVDVGANSGYHALIGARLVGSDGHVLAFEPATGPFNKLRRNLALNSFRNLIIEQAALGKRPGRAVIYPSAVPNNDGLGSLLPGPYRSVVGENVFMTSLDRVVEWLPGGKVDLVKVDVEGSEGDVFAGAQTLLGGGDAPALLFESFEVDSIVKVLGRFGYEVRHVHYSLESGLKFPRVGERFDNLFTYEAPNYVALKPHGRRRTFKEISERSKDLAPWLLHLLAAVA